ncbi:salutaridine reductase-like isoform X2 [Phragmites australis]|uniref:salutaridine reductase-like isoform X2 n=1 Tax=Phragmites australis TaxID=29695 RepID=UPI002D786485|nr:salutaridine reductase-like isoform X2 [Phragmites australis]
MEGARISSLPSTRIALVTGGNKGIGLEVCRQLAGNGVTVVLTARDETRGAVAVEKLRDLGLSSVIFHQLDVTDAPSIARLADFLRTRFGKLDILVNNAALSGLEYLQDHVDATSTESEEKASGMDMTQRLEWVLKRCRETYDAGKECLRTNYYGTKQVIEALLPLLQASDDGRIVNVSSEFGQLRQRGAEARAERRHEPHRGETGRGAGHVSEGPGDRRGGGARVADGLLGVQGVQGGPERVLEDPGAEAPHAARQLRAPRLREDRHDPRLRLSDARGRREQAGGGGAAACRRAHRLVLRRAPGGAVRVILGRCHSSPNSAGRPAILDHFLPMLFGRWKYVDLD